MNRSSNHPDPLVEAVQTTRSFGLQCRATGLVKAYMQMSQQEAGNRNRQLENEASTCRWTFNPVPGPTRDDLGALRIGGWLAYLEGHAKRERTRLRDGRG